MNICIINGSPKPKYSVSGIIADHMSEILKNKHIIEKIHWKNLYEYPLYGHDAAVFIFPLYFDSIPSDMLRLLLHHEDILRNFSTDLNVYAIINNGLYEARQSCNAVDNIKYWCSHSGVKWMGALCIGAGPLLLRNKIGEPPLKKLDIQFTEISKCIVNGSIFHDAYYEPDISKSNYADNSNRGFIKYAEKHDINELLQSKYALE